MDELLRAQMARCSAGDVFETDGLACVEARKPYLDVLGLATEWAVTGEGNDKDPDEEHYLHLSPRYQQKSSRARMTKTPVTSPMVMSSQDTHAFTRVLCSGAGSHR
jgi:hypothetical protein